jgi:glycosyltransferase involved in cell wall biosynthesis
LWSNPFVDQSASSRTRCADYLEVSINADKSRTLRILIFYQTIYPDYFGGIELRNFELAKALATRGHEVTLAGFSDTTIATPQGVKRVLLGPRRDLYNSSGRRSLTHAIRLARAAMRLDLAAYDVVETASMPFAHLFPLAVRCAGRAKPLLITWYEYWGRYWLDYAGLAPGLVYFGAERILARLGTIALVTSDLTFERLRSVRNGRRIERLDCGVDLDRVARSREVTSSTVVSLIYVGRLMDHKRLGLLLNSLAQMPEIPGKRTLLRILGDGPEREPLLRMSDALGVKDRVSFVRRVETSEEVYAMLAASTLAVQPSAREGFGLFPLEALAAGLPVVYCDSPDSAVGELVRDRIEGIRVAAEAGALAKTLDALLGDDNERARLGANARHRAAEFSWTRIAERFEQLCRSAIDGAIPSARRPPGANHPARES